ncbi:MAG: hypothetical protein KRP56_02970 [Candidatus Methanogranum gryphiswaldense]|nr:MAG: hypothetical protein KRP56_02970 [Candidatus Methanogranum sp. U3.2.1]
MSFFDNPKNFGTAMLLAGLIAALVSLIGIISEALSSDVSVGLIIVAVGALIYGLMIAAIGQKIRVGEISQKIKILGSFIAVVGAGFIVKGFFSMIGETVDNADDLGIAVVGFFVALILGIIAIYISRTITDGQTTTMDRVFWIVLLVIFVIMIIASLVGIFSILDGGAIGILNAVASICNVVVYASLLVVLLSDDVKKELGMA